MQSMFPDPSSKTRLKDQISHRMTIQINNVFLAISRNLSDIFWTQIWISKRRKMFKTVSGMSSFQSPHRTPALKPQVTQLWNLKNRSAIYPRVGCRQVFRCSFNLSASYQWGLCDLDIFLWLENLEEPWSQELGSKRGGKSRGGRRW